MDSCITSRSLPQGTAQGRPNFLPQEPHTTDTYITSLHLPQRQETAQGWANFLTQEPYTINFRCLRPAGYEQILHKPFYRHMWIVCYKNVYKHYEMYAYNIYSLLVPACMITDSPAHFLFNSY